MRKSALYSVRLEAFLGNDTHLLSELIVSVHHTCVKVKVKFTLEQATKAQRGSRGITTLSLTSALDEGGWSTPRSGRFTPGKDPVPIV